MTGEAMENYEKPLKVLMVSTEYPPMMGGVGHYTANLTSALKKIGIEVLVVCNERGNGDFTGIYPTNNYNSDVLLDIVKNINPDLVHIQFEHGLYGLELDPINPNKTHSTIDSFYEKCAVPIITTFHSGYTFQQWMKLVVPLDLTGSDSKLRIYCRMALKYWKHLLNYRSFHSLIRKKIGAQKYGIVFSDYLSKRIPQTHKIYHGAEALVPPTLSKSEARQYFSIPEEHKIALALGFLTKTKGWDLLNDIEVPKGWKIVVNSAKNHYNIEKTKFQFKNADIINLKRGHLSDLELSFLFHSADVLLLPYLVSSASGVMFDGLAHNLPFIASNIEFFKEFSALGLGLSVKRKPNKFSAAITKIDKDYNTYRNNVVSFKQNLLWSNIAEQHEIIYQTAVQERNIVSC
jgi:glycosyltransferase involved in cell wall biosynthesis